MKLITKLYKRLRQQSPKQSKFEKKNRRFKNKYPHYSIGRGSYGVPEVHDWNEGATLKIGSFCSISSYVQIFLGGEHRPDWVTTSPLSLMFENNIIEGHSRSKGDVIIGNDVWICANVTILSGVTIGDGAVIANGAIVTRDVEPYSIVAGNPAKKIKERFSPEIVNQLLSIAWWNWPELLIRKHMTSLQSNEIEKFIQIAKQINKDEKGINKVDII
ncbi:MAG: DapH/DapD/GlmU-related protein [Gammaproteobacteria bacterium]|nr:DapH/DapD/GlmU-related protein [Gammaproteobacteria bacterium]